MFTRHCDASYRQDIDACQVLPNVTGIVCACAKRFCNGGKRNEMMTTEYENIRKEYGIVDRIDYSNPGNTGWIGGDDSSQKKYNYLETINGGQTPGVDSAWLVVLATLTTWHH